MSSNNASTTDSSTASQQLLSLQPQLQQQQQNQQQQSPLPNSHQFRAISRNNSNTSTSSSNRGEFNSLLSTSNSVASSRSQLASRAHQLMATCGGGTGASSTPIRSFQRATISSVVKTRAFDNNPVLKGLLTSASPSGQNSASNSQTPSPLSTPVFSRSRSLRMSGGSRRYQQSPSHHFRTNSRTPEIYSFNSGDTSMTIGSYSNETQAKLMQLSSERSELKESLEFLECERQVLIDSAKELREILHRERSQWKKEQDELKKQLTDSIAARVRAESHSTRLDVDTNDMRSQFKKLTDELQSKNKQIELLNKDLEKIQSDLEETTAINNELKLMLSKKLLYNGSNSSNGQQFDNDCLSIVTEMAKLRLELNEKNEIISSITANKTANQHQDSQTNINNVDKKVNCDIETLNRFLDQTVECIKGWPDELASSSHVQNLMKTLLSAYKPEQDLLCSKFQNIQL